MRGPRRGHGHRRDQARAALVAAAALACGLALATDPAPSTSAAATAQRAKTAERPNVILIQTDDQWDTLIGMPSVRKLIAGGGVTFQNSIVSNPLCCPSRASVLTGQHSHNHGVLSNTPPEGGYSAFRGRGNTLPVWMKKAGYRTVIVGKYMNHFTAPPRGRMYVPPGWQRWVLFNGGGGAYYNYTLNVNGRTQRFGAKQPARNYATDVLRRKLSDELDRAMKADRPLFLNFAPSAPHSEFLPFGSPRNPRVAPRHFGRLSFLTMPEKPSYDESDVSDKPQFVQNTPPLSESDRAGLPARYLGGLESLFAVDDAIRMTIRKLRRAGRLRNTLIIFTSDNGLMLGEHRLRGKAVLYEESLQVPLLIRGPGFPAGVVRDQLVENTDITATILRAARVKPGRVLDGYPLQPFAQSPSYRASRYLLIENDSAEGLRTPRWVYIEHHTGERELYDLLADPYELQSLHDDPAYDAVQADLAARLQAVRSCAGSGCP